MNHTESELDYARRMRTKSRQALDDATTQYQSMNAAGRQFKKFPLAELRSEVEHWESTVARLESGGRRGPIARHARVGWTG